MVLKPGKLPIKKLKELISFNGFRSNSVIVGPKEGVDFAVVATGDEFLIVSSDPVTGTSSRAGWYAVNIGCNDVATSGNRPQFIEVVTLVPEGLGERELRKIFQEVDSACKELEVSVLGGHTEITRAVKRPIIETTAFCFAKKYVSSEMARAGDKIVMTKSAGLEGTSILANHEKAKEKLSSKLIKKAESFSKEISIVREAVTAASTGLVNAMHDCTEGGLIAALYEMAYSSGLGFYVDSRNVKIREETLEICELFKIDPLKLLSSGSLLISTNKPEVIIDELRKFTECSIIGEFTSNKKKVIKYNVEKEIKEVPRDELWKIL